MFVVDTNLLLYAVNPDSPDHSRAHALLDQWRYGERTWFLTWGIVYEFLRVSTHGSVFPQPLDLSTARAWIQAAMAGPQSAMLTETDRHEQVLDQLVTEYPRVRGNPVHDLHTAALMREHGVTEIRTADTDFHQFSFLDVVDPLTAND